eukprot:TRINITY_DN16781_c0_g1_i2.p1 TRINITY_DN16781_c0_g1~~TRINITY_DN16781_c0_g1_i2.p1  ORF type:complete len:369 (-),score=53.65 TRINITY_DN16781_c0_g1_i2:243-1349(-)
MFWAARALDLQRRREELRRFYAAGGGVRRAGGVGSFSAGTCSPALGARMRLQRDHLEAWRRSVVRSQATPGQATVPVLTPVQVSGVWPAANSSCGGTVAPSVVSSVIPVPPTFSASDLQATTWVASAGNRSRSTTPPPRFSVTAQGRPVVALSASLAPASPRAACVIGNSVTTADAFSPRWPQRTNIGNGGNGGGSLDSSCRTLPPSTGYSPQVATVPATVVPASDELGPTGISGGLESVANVCEHNASGKITREEFVRAFVRGASHATAVSERCSPPVSRCNSLSASARTVQAGSRPVSPPPPEPIAACVGAASKAAAVSPTATRASSRSTLRPAAVSPRSPAVTPRACSGGLSLAGLRLRASQNDA